MSTAASALDLLKDCAAIGWLRERDLDLLLCAELHVEGPLRASFAALWPNRRPTFSGAWISHSDSLGESDLVVQFRDGETHLVLLVENKIAAEFQPEQPERYLARASRLRESGALVLTVLVCPEGYLFREGAGIFDVRLSYEQMIRVLADTTDPRSRFFARCLAEGMEGYRRGYTLIPDVIVTALWSRIWEVSTNRTPDLMMERPKDKPGQSGWVYFNRPRGFTEADCKRVVIAFKASRGQVDLQVGGTTPEELHRCLAGIPLDPDMQIVKAAKSASLRIATAMVDFSRPPEGQEEAIRMGLQQAERLRRFFLDHRIGRLVRAI